ncbi:hypothetical protein POVWA2_043230 [Plasmodium ovale wallikeri]|uniref:Uncharacterized protein n=1 Tax=Plasmodium ovale wallikeri TaxID=864142 RepID=A0A1A8ZD30_PLAOA|nr:hypothetical protein POVWA1_044640 [Plasmodium ovale wallikeri]SBT42134.1 hypothetical protein POVWA2_043230 [Plasmodium ovale wallikeri]
MCKKKKGNITKDNLKNKDNFHEHLYRQKGNVAKDNLKNKYNLKDHLCRPKERRNGSQLKIVIARRRKRELLSFLKMRVEGPEVTQLQQ